MRNGEVVRIEVPSSCEYVAVIRQMVEGIARKLAFSVGDIDDLKLAVGEACTNAVKYGAKKDARVTVRCVLSDRGLEIEICNCIPAGATCPVITQPDPSHMREGGMGLFLMKRLMDEVELFWEEGLAMVKMVKKIPQPVIAYREP